MPVSSQNNGLGIGTQLPNGRPVSGLQTLHQDYRPFSYGAASTPLSSIPYTSATSASNLPLPTAYAPSDQGPGTNNQMQQDAHTLDSMRNKFGNASYSYTGYIQQ